MRNFDGNIEAPRATTNDFLTGALEIGVKEVEEAGMSEEVVTERSGYETNYGGPLIGFGKAIRDLELNGGKTTEDGMRAADKINGSLFGSP
jgi:hypothetical protein